MQEQILKIKEGIQDLRNKSEKVTLPVLPFPVS